MAVINTTPISARKLWAKSDAMKVTDVYPANTQAGIMVTGAGNVALVYGDDSNVVDVLAMGAGDVLQLSVGVTYIKSTLTTATGIYILLK